MPISYTFPNTGVPTIKNEWSSEEAPRVKRAQFGDSYAQTAKDGINALKRGWSVAWEPLTGAQRDTIRNFLRNRGGSEAFYWLTPEGETVKIKCGRWKVEKMSGSWFSMSAEFEEVFDA